MAQIELIMPKMGESIMEATIQSWVKNVGDAIEIDETVLEISTDKVDSEIPSPVAGTLAKILYQEGDVVEIGKPIAIIATEGEEVQASPSVDEQVQSNGNVPAQEVPVAAELESQMEVAVATVTTSEVTTKVNVGDGRFYSPLVKNIAKKENISKDELDTIPGSGLKGRVTKRDMLSYLKNRNSAPATSNKSKAPASVTQQPTGKVSASGLATSKSVSGDVEIVEMDRIRKLIADHMVNSKKTSPHVTSFVEVDVTNIVNWRNRIKADFQKAHGQKITFTPIFVDAVAKAIRDFPMINVSVDGTKIMVKKDINIGMATALPSGNLIVPVIKAANLLNLTGLTYAVNDLANRARNNKLKPDETQGGTFTLTNVGTFGNVMGTPIINQPQVAIMATGAIRKKPAVVETEFGDLIAVRHMMFLSMSYDHRVVDGFLGGSFLRKVGDYLEQFDTNQSI